MLRDVERNGASQVSARGQISDRALHFREVAILAPASDNVGNAELLALMHLMVHKKEMHTQYARARIITQYSSTQLPEGGLNFVASPPICPSL